MKSAARVRWLPVGLVFGFSVLYMATLSAHYSGDSLMHAYSIRESSLTGMMARHRLLMNPLGYAVAQVIERAVPGHDLLWRLQVFNAMAGAIAIGLVFGIARYARASRGSALLAASGFGVSYAGWLFSVEAEMVMPAITVMLVGIWMALDLALQPSVGVRRLYAAAALTSLALLLYAQWVLLVPLTVLALVLAEGSPMRRRLKMAVSYCAGVAFLSLVVFGLYLAETGAELAAGLYGGQGAGIVYGSPFVREIPFGVYAFVRSIANFPLISPGVLSQTYLRDAAVGELGMFAAFQLGLLALALVPFGIIASSWRGLDQAARKTISLLVVWCGMCSAFALYWVPRDQQFWLPVAAVWWVLLGFTVSAVASSRRQSSPLVAMTLLVGILFGVNFIGAIQPRRDMSTNRQLQVAETIRLHTEPGDLVVTLDDDRYVQYFSHRQWTSLYTVLLDDRSDSPQAPTDRMLDRILGQMQHARVGGGRVYYLVRQLSHADEVRFRAVGLDPEIWRRWNTVPVWQVAGFQFVEVVP